MTGLGAIEVLALLLISTVLLAVGFLLVFLGATASRNEGAVKSKGLVVLLLGPIPLVLRGSARIALLAFALVAALLLLFLFLVF
jgi:uncharacterized membrane protein